jgi:hypothetical protein
MDYSQRPSIKYWSADRDVIIEPKPGDILLGRGKAAFQHEGNSRLRLVIIQTLGRFTTSKSRIEKTNMVRSIVKDIIDRGGRFLKKDPKKPDWYLAGFKDAREKVSHALRDAANNKVKCMLTWKESYLSENMDQRNKTALSKIHQKRASEPRSNVLVIPDIPLGFSNGTKISEEQKTSKIGGDAPCATAPFTSSKHIT